MAITATGIGSGMDVSGIVSQIMKLERAPLDQLKKKEDGFNAKISAFGQLKSVLSALNTEAKALNKPSLYNAVSAKVGPNAGFTATATSGAAISSYDIGVSQLAMAQRVASSAATELNPAAGGTLDVTIGSTTKSLNFAGGSIEDLRDAINGGDLGIRASVVNNGSVKQLVLTGKDSGAANQFTLNGTGALSGLSYDPATASTDPNSSVYRLQAAQNARLSIDGVTIERASNTITDAISNVTLNLTGTAAPARLDVAKDNKPASDAIQKFITAYNNAIDKINALGSYDAETKKAGELNGDSTLRGIRDRLRNFLSSDFSGPSTLSRLNEVGLKVEVSGKLTLEQDKFEAAMAADSSAVSRFFAGNGTLEGFAGKLDTLTFGFTQTSGLIDLRTKGLQNSIKSLDRQRDALELRLTRVQAMYEKQFNAMDSFVAAMTTTGNYLTQQLSALRGGA